ncbi:hypothetical protein N9P71_02940 [Saprospiraceae bacterium]|nr:hypothetical protein [Saprospiraceae bacterium]
MNIIKSTIGFSLMVMLLPCCSSLRINQTATTDKTLAITAIEQIKESGIVVIFPTKHKKEKALKNFAKKKPSIQKDIDALLSKRKRTLEIWQNTKNKYSFSRISIVPDSLLKSYIADPNNAKEIGPNGKKTHASLGEIYVLYTDYGGFEVKQNGEYLPNPFPNKVQPAWGSSIKDFLGVQSEENSITRFFTELDNQLTLFFRLTKIEGN